MTTFAYKTQRRKAQAAAVGSSKMQRESNPTFQFHDYRPISAAQRKLQKIANSSSQVTQAAQLQAIAKNHILQHQHSIQKIENRTVTAGQERYLPTEAWHVPQPKSKVDAVSPQLSPAGAGAAFDTVPTSKPQGTVPLQMLMSTQAFKDITYLIFAWGRNQVVSVDTAVTAYHQVSADDRTGRIAALATVIDECDTYIQIATKARRKPGVRLLKTQAESERGFLQDIEAVDGLDEDVARLAELRRLDNMYHAIHKSGNELPREDFDAIQSELKNTTIEDIVEALQSRDIGMLEGIEGDEQAPQIIRLVIEELLANQDKVTFAETIGGANAQKTGEDAYKVTYGQYLGDTERLGSLVHELTHVSASESYGNTRAMLAYEQDTSVENIIRLSAERTEKAKELGRLLDEDTAFSEPQRKKLKQQIDYGQSKGKLSKYLEAVDYQYWVAKRSETQWEGEMPSARLLAAYRQTNGELTLAFMEYDTVINQMLVYMHVWKVPQDNAFYAQLRVYAEDSYRERKAARESLL